jgi:hypothetical protein
MTEISECMRPRALDWALGTALGTALDTALSGRFETGGDATMGVADAFDRVFAALPKSCPLDTLSMKDLNKVDSFSFLGTGA